MEEHLLLFVGLNLLQRNKASSIGFKKTLVTITFAFTFENVVQGALVFMFWNSSPTMSLVF